MQPNFIKNLCTSRGNVQISIESKTHTARAIISWLVYCHFGAVFCLFIFFVTVFISVTIF